MSIYDDMDMFKHHGEPKSKPYAGEPKEKELARAYVPFQKISRIYSPDESLKAGTIFPELYCPYERKHKK